MVMRIEEEIKQYNFKSLEQKTSLNILYTASWINQLIDCIFKEEQITRQQFNILRILRGQSPKPISIKEIRERMLDKMSDVSRIVEKLRIKGLIVRKENLSDRRNVDVLLTEQGEKLLSKIDPLVDGINKNFNSLTEAEHQLLNNLLDKLRG